MNAPAIERVNVNLPRPLLDDLRRLVPRSRRSEVIARATARELRRLKLAALFTNLSKDPVWRAEDHIGLSSGAAIDAFVMRLRAHGASVPVAAEVTQGEIGTPSSKSRGARRAGVVRKGRRE
jgi:hypothetical protein